MKKHLIAAAVAAAVAAPAMAQNVEVYGVLDIGYADNKLTSKANSTAESTDNKINRFGGFAGLSGNRLGFRGTEDLGGGLKANFVLEASVATNLGFGAHRLANVGLAGNMGTVTVGRQVSFGKSVMDSYTAFGGGGNFITGSTVHAASGMTTSDQLTAESIFLDGIGAFSGRRGDALTYMSPRVSGIQVGAQFLRNSNDSSTLEGKSGDNSTALQINYVGGPLSVAFSRTDAKAKTQEVAGTRLFCASNTAGAGNVTTVAAGATTCGTGNTRLSGTAAVAESSTDITLNQFGAKYTIGNISLFLAHASNSDEVDGAGDDDIHSKATDVGITVGLGATTLLASIGNGRVDYDSGNGKADLDGYTLQAHYALSKRSTLYAIYGSSTFEMNNQGGGAEGKEKLTMMGMRHSF